ncbi:hypothetical protein GGI17_000050 [Coemansia sp. S146]|nr:hypothetical protein GGI17_000050 [Coemansia sp. S146]
MPLERLFKKCQGRGSVELISDGHAHVDVRTLSGAGHWQPDPAPNHDINRSSSEKLRVLLQWFAENKITYNEEAIKIVDQQATASSSATSKGTAVLSHGFGVVSLRKLESDEQLVVIPKSAVISAATSALANIFIDADIGGNLALCITVMYEKSLGHESPWYGYLQSLPECADIPLLWDALSRSWLKGTDVGEWISRDEASLLEDFGVLQDLVAEYPAVFGGSDFKWDCFESFVKIASLVSSRAFSVDVHRDNSMVPFADIFNHRTAKENVHIVCEEMVCPVCGEAFGCAHMDALEEMDNHEGASEDEDEGEDNSESEEDSEYEEDDDSSDSESEDEMGEELPLLVDLMGNTVADELQQDEDIEMESVGDERSEHSGEIDSDDDQEDELVDTLEMVVFRPCKANTEVFNTYGEHGSAYLLHRYGFCDTKNPFDSVSLSTENVMQAFAISVSEQRAKDVSTVIRRFEDLFESRHRACGQDEDEEEEAHDHEHGHDEDSDEDGEEGNDEDEEQDNQADDDDNAPRFSIDAPGHPDLNLAALLVLGLADEEVFSKASQSEEIFRHYFPVIRRFWAMFQDELDNDTPVPAAFRKANQEGAVRKASVGTVSNVVYRLAEARLQLLTDDSVLGEKPATDSDPLMANRWESAKLLRSNERKTLSQCIKTYKKIATKMS